MELQHIIASRLRTYTGGVYPRVLSGLEERASAVQAMALMLPGKDVETAESLSTKIACMSIRGYNSCAGVTSQLYSILDLIKVSRIPPRSESQLYAQLRHCFALPGSVQRYPVIASAARAVRHALRYCRAICARSSRQ